MSDQLLSYSFGSSGATGPYGTSSGGCDFETYPSTLPRLDAVFGQTYTRAEFRCACPKSPSRMKSEHRHELKTNELEKIASEWGHTFEHYLQDNLMLIGAGVVVIALVV